MPHSHARAYLSLMRAYVKLTCSTLYVPRSRVCFPEVRVAMPACVVVLYLKSYFGKSQLLFLSYMTLNKTELM